MPTKRRRILTVEVSCDEGDAPVEIDRLDAAMVTWNSSLEPGWTLVDGAGQGGSLLTREDCGPFSTKETKALAGRLRDALLGVGHAIVFLHEDYDHPKQLLRIEITSDVIEYSSGPDD